MSGFDFSGMGGMSHQPAVMDIFHELHEKQGKTIVLITHNPALAQECQRVLTLRDGQFISEKRGLGYAG